MPNELDVIQSMLELQGRMVTEQLKLIEQVKVLTAEVYELKMKDNARTEK